MSTEFLINATVFVTTIVLELAAIAAVCAFVVLVA
jgi:hypothetical protein